jgi:hypothetical protein
MASFRLCFPCLFQPNISTTKALALRDTTTSYEFGTARSSGYHICRSANGAQRANAHGSTWESWFTFCQGFKFPPILETVRDPLPFFFIFGVRYRDGRLAKDGHTIRAHTMEEAFCAISQTMAGLGADHKQLDLLIVARPTHLYISTAALHFPNKARSRQL